MIRIVSILALVLLASTQSCGPGGESQPDVLVMSYNLMTLFDPVDQGGEYAEFRVAAGSWDKTAYDRRIALLASAIVAAAPGGPDVQIGRAHV